MFGGGGGGGGEVICHSDTLGGQVHVCGLCWLMSMLLPCLLLLRKAVLISMVSTATGDHVCDQSFHRRLCQCLWSLMPLGDLLISVIHPLAKICATRGADDP